MVHFPEEKTLIDINLYSIGYHLQHNLDETRRASWPPKALPNLSQLGATKSPSATPA